MITKSLKLVKLRLKRLKQALDSGRIPIIRVPTPGAEELLRQYKVNMNEYYIPTIGKDKKDLQKERQLLRNKQRYKRSKKFIN